jgi:predicted DNA-binding transcriptional regulator AlpA
MALTPDQCREARQKCPFPSRPPSYISRASLARELDMAESTVDEMVRRGVLPRPVKLSPGCVRWRWEAVEMALASLGGRTHDAAAISDMQAVENAIKASKERRHSRSP